MIASLLKFFLPVIKWWGALHFPYTRKKITGKEYYHIHPRLEAGDIFLTYTEGEFSNLINPAKWKHGAIYLGMVEGIPTIFESVGVGVRTEDLITFLTSKDRIMILRSVKKIDSNELMSICKELKGLSYDFEFKMGNKSYYCFELVVEVIGRLTGIKFRTLKAGKSHEYYTDESFLANEYLTQVLHY